LPESEFTNLFKLSNQQYAQVKDLERIDQFFEKTFGGDKINFKEARKFFSDPKVEKSFKNTLGEDALKDVKAIMNDFISTEQQLKLVKKAEQKGLGDILPTVKKWAISPLWGKESALKSVAANVRNDLLANQKFRITWKNALNDLKAERFKKAVDGFKDLDTMVSNAENQPEP